MAREYLERESIREHSGRRKFFLALFVFFSCISAVLYFTVGRSLDLSNPDDKKLFAIFAVMAGLMLFCTAVQLVTSILPAKNGRNLILPLGETTREEAAEIINREAAEGKILYEGSMDCNATKKHSDRIAILPSYILLIRGMGQITAIPRDKIDWICAQRGYKGGPYFARLLIFTEKKLIAFNGNDFKHTEEVAENLYRYIPNVFKNYMAPHELEKLYHENREGFMRLYEQEKQKLREI